MLKLHKSPCRSKQKKLPSHQGFQMVYVRRPSHLPIARISYWITPGRDLGLHQVNRQRSPSGLFPRGLVTASLFCSKSASSGETKRVFDLFIGLLVEQLHFRQDIDLVVREVCRVDDLRSRERLFQLGDL